MKKIPTLFVRDEKTRRVTPEVTPGCEWVLAGDGIPSRKWDGTCCLIRDGRLFKRHDASARLVAGALHYNKPTPFGFEPCQGHPDPATGHYPGWVPVGDGPEDRWHREAMVIDGPVAGEILMPRPAGDARDGTYELCGPKIQGNPEKFRSHVLVPHGQMIIYYGGIPTFEMLRDFLANDANDIEGIVWHSPWTDQRAKLKKRDLGFRRP